MDAALVSPSAAKAASSLAITTSYRPPASRLDVNGRSPSITSPMSGRRPAPLQPVIKAAASEKSHEEKKEQEDDERLQERVMRAKREKKKKRQTMPEKSGLREVSGLLNG